MSTVLGTKLAKKLSSEAIMDGIQVNLLCVSIFKCHILKTNLLALICFPECKEMFHLSVFLAHLGQINLKRYTLHYINNSKSHYRNLNDLIITLPIFL